MKKKKKRCKGGSPECWVGCQLLINSLGWNSEYPVDDVDDSILGGNVGCGDGGVHPGTLQSHDRGCCGAAVVDVEVQLAAVGEGGDLEILASGKEVARHARQNTFKQGHSC